MEHKGGDSWAPADSYSKNIVKSWIQGGGRKKTHRERSTNDKDAMLEVTSYTSEDGTRMVSYLSPSADEKMQLMHKKDHFVSYIHGMIVLKTDSLAWSEADRCQKWEWFVEKQTEK